MNRINVIFFLLGFISAASAHSEMRCAKYNKVTGECYAPIRNQGVSFLEEASLFTNGGPICQSPMTNPISASYANGAGCPDWAPCPNAMGTFARGESFSIMWWARNHAIAEQNPATVKLYMSPKEASNQGADVSQTTMSANLICQGPYMNCGGVNVDNTPCTLDCVMPNVEDGIYTFWWKWDWQVYMYTTCADVIVSGGSASPVTPPAVGTTAAANTGRSTTARSTTARSTTARASTTAAATTKKATTGRSTSALPASSTTAAVPSTPAPSTPAPSTPAPSTPAPSGNGCVMGHQQCVGSNTYQTCGWATATQTGWSTPMSCPAGLSCHQVQGDYVWCY